MVRRSRRSAPGVAALVAMVALLPLFGFAVVTTREARSANREATDTAEIESVVSEMRDITRVHAAVTVERWWGHAILAVARMGVPPEFVVAALGTDLELKYGEAVVDVDELLETAGINEIGPDLISARSNVDSGVNSESSFEAVGDAYLTIDSELTRQATSTLRNLMLVGGDTPGASELVRNIEALETAVAMRHDAAAIVRGAFGLRFLSFEEKEREGLVLLDAVRSYEIHRERLEVLIDGDENLSAAWAGLEGDSQVSQLMAQAEAAAAETTRSGTDLLLTQELVFTEIDPAGEAQRFLDSIAAIDRHVELVDAIVEEASEAASVLRVEAEERRSQTLVWYGFVFVLSAAGVALAAQWIVRPLTRMAEVVGAMRSGLLDGEVDRAGPREVREAASALNEATAHLRLAEKQALALMSEDLSNPVLGQSAPGALGESLNAAVGRLAASLTEREQFRQRLAHEAAHDGLTGLANRAASLNELTSALARVRRAESTLAVLFVDLDNFKPVNDQIGHAAGDRVLRTIAQRLGATARAGDHVGRLGGDEFVVIAEPVNDLGEAIGLAERMLAAIAAPITVGATVVRPAASVGVALAGRSDLTADEILRDADLAVYQAKASGRNRIEVCDDALREQLKHRSTIEQSLRIAIANDELTMNYQSITDARSGAVDSLEALVRWNHPDGTIIGPDEFIPIAERSDLIVDLDCWVLRTVTRQMAEWISHPQLGGLAVSINLSARHLAAPTLMNDVLGSIADAGIDPKSVILEITESALLGDIDRAARRLAELRAHGIRIAIDDFGTGYTSLSHLRRLPVDVLKIDRSFVANLERSDDRSLVKLIVETGHLLGVSVTAEGVETLEQAEMLIALGSDHLQGYRFSRPLPPAELEAASLDQAAGS